MFSFSATYACKLGRRKFIEGVQTHEAGGTIAGTVGVPGRYTTGREQSQQRRKAGGVARPGPERDPTDRTRCSGWDRVGGATPPTATGARPGRFRSPLVRFRPVRPSARGVRRWIGMRGVAVAGPAH
jgi:hypothetical protein